MNLRGGEHGPVRFGEWKGGDEEPPGGVVATVGVQPIETNLTDGVADRDRLHLDLEEGVEIVRKMEFLNLAAPVLSGGIGDGVANREVEKADGRGVFALALGDRNLVADVELHLSSSDPDRTTSGTLDEE
jgi:hypothetical protein